MGSDETTFQHGNNMKNLLALFCLLAISQSQDCDDCAGGTCCTAGCCPHPNWHCCSDNVHCAMTTDHCPSDCVGGTVCPSGCCPHLDWVCCEDNIYCAATDS